MANQMEFEAKKSMYRSLSSGCNPFEDIVLFNVAGFLAEIHLPDLAPI
ncbi:hypothetical protein QUB47_04900 [Microcoleus sp. AT9_B5]